MRGRPKKTTKDFPEDWKQGIHNLYIRGGCDVEVRSYLGGIAIETLARMMDEDQELFDSIKRGRVHAEAWWKEQGRTGLPGGKINVGMYAINMRNRFGWYDANKQGDSIDNIGERLDKIARALAQSDTDTS